MPTITSIQPAFGRGGMESDMARGRYPQRPGASTRPVRARRATARQPRAKRKSSRRRGTSFASATKPAPRATVMRDGARLEAAALEIAGARSWRTRFSATQACS